LRPGGPGGLEGLAQVRRGCRENVEPFVEIVVGRRGRQRVVDAELFDPFAVDHPPQDQDGLRPGGEAAGAVAGADGAAVSGEFAREPVDRGPVDRQHGGVGDNGRHGTPWEMAEAVVTPVSPRGFPCATTDLDHRPYRSPCAESLTEFTETPRASAMNRAVYPFAFISTAFAWISALTRGFFIAMQVFSHHHANTQLHSSGLGLSG